MQEVVIVSATRTAIGKFGGALKDIPPGKLGAEVLKDALTRGKVEAGDVDEVIMGNVLSGGQGMNVARQCSIWAGLPVSVPAFSVNKVCGSGLKSVALGAQSIMLGDNKIVLAGGTESMSSAMFALPHARWGMKMGNGETVDTMISDGLWDVFNQMHMGMTAENLAEKYGISREEQDRFAMQSQNKAEKAIKSNLFKDEIVPINVPAPKGDPVIFDTDEFPRFGSNMEGLAKLKPAFKKNGTVTAGNASGVNDGAAAVLLMSREAAEGRGIKPMATIEGFSSCALEPAIMGVGAACAARSVLSRTELAMSDIDLVEENEAFAAQSIAVDRELGWDAHKINVNGGAVALGHPIGASGTRILVTLLYEMERRSAEYGLATLCIGGGQGIAMVLRR